MAKGRLIASLLALLAPLPALAFSLAELQPLLAAVERAEARFVEEHHLAMLDQPLTSGGTVSYRAPDFLRKSVDHPQPGSYTVEGERLIVEQKGERQVLDLASAPQLKAFTESFRAVLAGDFESLNRLYGLTLKGSSEDWTLRLEPREAPLSRLIYRVTVSGTGDEVRRFEVQEHGGDRSIMNLEAPCREDGC